MLIIPFTGRNIMTKESNNPFKNGYVDCALQLQGVDNISNGYVAGFNHEMLKRFADSMEDTARIFLAEKDSSYYEAILRDSIDILAIPADKYVPAEGLTILPFDDSLVVWVTRNDPAISEYFARWRLKFKGSPEYSSAKLRYFHGFNPYNKKYKRDKSIISPYDDILKEEAGRIGWDWKLMAALIWSESKFRIQEQSPRGAFGLMQMMPHTAGQMELEDMLDPRSSIKAGANLLNRLQKMFQGTAADKEELTKFTLAAYNAGEGRILDCIRFAKEKGIDPSTWDNICSVIPQMSQNADSMDPSDVTYRPFKGFETKAYIKAVLNQYDVFRGETPRYTFTPSETIDSTAVDSLMTLPEDKEDFAGILLSPDSLSRVDPSNEEARNEEEEHDDKE
jgi:Predicted soluble lytic transglycosylase fused to an ABC-type amino acid-binding protein